MKNTKNLFMLVAALLFAGSTAFAQIEVNLAVGFHSGAFQTTGPDAESITGPSDNITMSNIYSSLGGGIPINLGVGIPISDHITFNADFTYWMGSEVTMSETDVTADIGGGNTLNSTDITMARSNQIRFNPGLTFSADNGLYGRVALVIPVGGKTTFTNDMREVNSGGGEVFANIEGESSGKFSLGASAAVGFALDLADNMKLGFEVQSLALNIQNTSQVVTSYEDSDGGSLDDFPTFFKETNFVDELDNNSNTLDNPDVDFDKPMDALAGRSSFGAWGFNVRFIYIIGG